MRLGMGALTEVEIFSAMSDSLSSAIQRCRDLCSNNAHGPSYDALRRDLHTIEGCCRQASAWRGDTRWLRIGIMMGELHKKAGEWLRGYPIPGTFGRYYPSRRLFETLSANLTAIKREADNLRTKATGRVGLILPDVLPAPLRTEGRPMQVILPHDQAA